MNSVKPPNKPRVFTFHCVVDGLHLVLVGWDLT